MLTARSLYGCGFQTDSGNSAPSMSKKSKAKAKAAKRFAVNQPSKESLSAEPSQEEVAANDELVMDAPTAHPTSEPCDMEDAPVCIYHPRSTARARLSSVSRSHTHAICRSRPFESPTLRLTAFATSHSPPPSLQFSVLHTRTS